MHSPVEPAEDTAYPLDCSWCRFYPPGGSWILDYSTLLDTAGKPFIAQVLLLTDRCPNPNLLIRVCPSLLNPFLQILRVQRQKLYIFNQQLLSMPLRCFFLYCFPLCICFAGAVNAQDSASRQSASATAKSFYFKFIGENSHFYNGTEYIPFDVHIKGNSFFLTDQLQPATISYDNLFYQDVALCYDIMRDEVIANRFDRQFRIKLVSSKIAFFSFPDHFFERLVQDSVNKSVISTGFYERVYNGREKVYIKHTKKIEEKITDYAGDEQWFTEQDNYLVEKEGRFYPVQTKSMLFEIIKDRKKEVQRYLRKNKLKFRKDPGNTIRMAIEYYDQVKHNL